MLKSPGALGGMLGMGSGQLKQAVANLNAGAEGLDGLSLPAAGASLGMNQPGGRPQQSRSKGGSSKKKRGGRVTPKGGGRGR